jgi:hypothetical protein
MAIDDIKKYIEKLCTPTKFFLIYMFIYLIYSIYMFFKGNSSNKKIPFISILSIKVLVIIGWASIIDYFCDNTDNYISWGLASIPIFFNSLRIVY